MTTRARARSPWAPLVTKVLGAILGSLVDLRGDLASHLRDVEVRGEPAKAALLDLAPRPEELIVPAFEILAAGVLPAAAQAPGEPAGEIALSVRQRELLLQVLTSSEPTLLRRRVLERVTAGDPISARRAALLVLERAGTVADLDPAITLASGDGAQALFLSRELEAVVGGIFARDPRAERDLRGRLSVEQGELRRHLVRGIGRSASRPGIALLGASLFEGDPQIVTLLEGLADLARAVGGPFDERELDAVEHLLGAREEISEAAARAAGALGDRRLVPCLVELLEAPSVRARAAAHRALVELSGRSFGPEAGTWRAWYGAELAWWEGSWPALVRVLAQGEAHELAGALASAATHGLYRAEIAPPVEDLLDHESGTVVRLACTCLRQLGARPSAPLLVPLLEDEEPAVVAAAHVALQRLTGETLPPDPVVWRSRIDDR